MKKNAGLSVIEVLIAIALLSIYVALSIDFSDSINHSTQLGRTQSTRDRISSGIRNIAGMPVALRNAMRAALPGGVTPFNLAFYNCVSGTNPTSCNNNQDYPLALFSPTVAMTSTGALLGIVQITSPTGTPPVNHFNSFGVPCVVTDPDCLFVVHTSFRAQCPPATLTATSPLPTDPAFIGLMSPMPTCTVAEVVNVAYTVEIDPALVSLHPGLSGFIAPITGSVSTSVKSIFGNDPW
ncbi:MAG: pilus assembly FimT family protein [Pseudobdellovibrionaceae bacterium]